MAQSPAHRFGQIIGEVLEAAVVPVLTKFARQHRLYLDRKGPRPCRSGLKCRWVDENGNAHDLDFVLERGGTPSRIGTPAAFIETAWRRYTKHSRNKVQEIQGAVDPLAQTFRNARPFKGAILAGVFTEGALTQLRSLGFTVLYFPYASVVEVFAKFGIDARSDESTADAEFARRVRSYERLQPAARKKLAAALLKAHAADVKQFLASLEAIVLRQIERVVILTLHGTGHELRTIADAVRYIEAYIDDGRNKPIERFEISLCYTNGDQIHGSFKDKPAAVEFLQTFQPPLPVVE
jgi:hypothetical protein